MVENYIKLLEVLGGNIHKEMEVFKCQKGFKYGNSQKEITNMCCLIPTYVGGQRRKMLCYIIGGNAPILIGRPLMREFGIVVDYDNNMVRYRGGEWQEAELGPKGEYIVRLAADLEELRNNEDEQILMPDDFTDHIDTTDRLPLSAILDDEDIISRAETTVVTAPSEATPSNAVHIKQGDVKSEIHPSAGPGQEALMMMEFHRKNA